MNERVACFLVFTVLKPLIRTRTREGGCCLAAVGKFAGNSKNPVLSMSDSLPTEYTRHVWDDHCSGDFDVDLVWFLLIGLVAGWLASILIKVRGLGLAEKLIVGVIGAIIGGYLFRALPVDLPVSGTAGSLITATVGAAVLLFVLKLIRRY